MRYMFKYKSTLRAMAGTLLLGASVSNLTSAIDKRSILDKSQFCKVARNDISVWNEIDQLTGSFISALKETTQVDKQDLLNVSPALEGYLQTLRNAVNPQVLLKTVIFGLVCLLLTKYVLNRIYYFANYNNRADLKSEVLKHLYNVEKCFLSCSKLLERVKDNLTEKALERYEKMIGKYKRTMFIPVINMVIELGETLFCKIEKVEKLKKDFDAAVGKYKNKLPKFSGLLCVHEEISNFYDEIIKMRKALEFVQRNDTDANKNIKCIKREMDYVIDKDHIGLINTAYKPYRDKAKQLLKDLPLLLPNLPDSEKIYSSVNDFINSCSTSQG